MNLGEAVSVDRAHREVGEKGDDVHIHNGQVLFRFAAVSRQCPVMASAWEVRLEVTSWKIGSSY